MADTSKSIQTINVTETEFGIISALLHRAQIYDRTAQMQGVEVAGDLTTGMTVTDLINRTQEFFLARRNRMEVIVKATLSLDKSVFDHSMLIKNKAVKVREYPNSILRDRKVPSSDIQNNDDDSKSDCTEKKEIDCISLIAYIYLYLSITKEKMFRWQKSLALCSVKYNKFIKIGDSYKFNLNVLFHEVNGEFIDCSTGFVVNVVEAIDGNGRIFIQEHNSRGVER